MFIESKTRRHISLNKFRAFFYHFHQSLWKLGFGEKFFAVFFYHLWFIWISRGSEYLTFGLCLLQKYLQPLKSPENAGLVDADLVDEIFYQVSAAAKLTKFLIVQYYFGPNLLHYFDVFLFLIWLSNQDIKRCYFRLGQKLVNQTVNLFWICELIFSCFFHFPN